uniref:Uncharacterized protein n=1 Tax=Lepeophtheirus salmonis TaxID=72036 RepID=A0A0K2VAG1_LEPSM
MSLLCLFLQCRNSTDVINNSSIESVQTKL